MDVTRTFLAPPVPDGLGAACPMFGPSLLAVAEGVEVLLLGDVLVEAAVRAAVIAAPVDAAAVGLSPVIGIRVNWRSSGPSVAVAAVVSKKTEPSAPVVGSATCTPSPDWVQMALVVPPKEHSMVAVLHT